MKKLNSNETVNSVDGEEVKENVLGERKSDLVENLIILALSIVTCLVGAILNSDASRWLYTFSFVFAGYETLYSIIVKLCKKEHIIEEILILLSSLVLLYAGYGAVACLTVIFYSVNSIVGKFIVYSTMKRADNLRQNAEYETDEIVSRKLSLRAANLKSIAEKKPSCVITQPKFSVIYGAVVTVVGVCVAFLLPIFDSSSYSIALEQKYLPLGMLIVAISQLGVVALNKTICYISAVVGADKYGTVINSLETIECLSDVKRVAFDKTGVITDKASKVVSVSADDSARVLSLLYACEESINPSVASAVKIYAKENSIDILELDTFDVRLFSAKGVLATVDGSSVVIGNRKFLEESNVELPSVDVEDSIYFISENGKYLGYLTLRNVDKQSFDGVISELSHDLGLKTALISGDQINVVNRYKQKYDFDSAIASASSGYKVANVKSDGALYVGDSQLDRDVLEGVGLCVSIGEKVGDSSIVVEENDLRAVPRLIKLAKRTQTKVKATRYIGVAFKVCAAIFAAASLIFGFGYLYFAPIIAFIGDGISFLTSATNSSDAL